MKNLKNILLILKKPKYAAIFVAMTVVILYLYAFFMGLVAIPIINLRLIQMLLPKELDIVFMYVFAVLSGLFISAFFYISDQNKKIGFKCAGTGTGGIVAGFITAMCPFCPVWILSLFGVIGTLMVLAPFYPLFKIASMVLMISALVWISRKIKL